MTAPSFDEIYASVPAEQRERLRQFRETHPVHETTVDGTRWEYIASGEGDEVVLLLVGGLRVADAAFRAIPMLEDAFRVIIPTYPALDTMAELADGLAGVLTAEGVEKADVLAGSFGGTVAQVFVRRHPQKVAKLVLSTTGVPGEDLMERYRQGLQALEPMPEDDLREVAQRMMFDIIAPPEHEHDFYHAYLDELFTYRISKAEVLSTYRSLIDFGEHYELTGADLRDWHGGVLLLESDDDETFGDEARSSMRALYPQAQTHVFHGAGHSPGTTQRDLYFKIVRKFLQG